MQPKEWKELHISQASDFNMIKNPQLVWAESQGDQIRSQDCPVSILKKDEKVMISNQEVSKGHKKKFLR